MLKTGRQWLTVQHLNATANSRTAVPMWALVEQSIVTIGTTESMELNLL